MRLLLLLFWLKQPLCCFACFGDGIAFLFCERNQFSLAANRTPIEVSHADFCYPATSWQEDILSSKRVKDSCKVCNESEKH